MDPVVMAALITAAGAVTAAIISARSGRKNAQRAEEAEATLNEVLGAMKTRGELASERTEHTSFTVRRRTYKAIVSDLDGTVVLIQSMDGVKTRPGVSIPSLSGGVTFRGEMVSPPTVTDLKPFPKAVDMHIVNRDKQRCDFRIDVTGNLSDGDPPLGLTYQIELAHELIMNAEKVKEAYKNDRIKHEYYSVDSDNPPDVLEIEVELPEGCAAKMYPLACVNGSEVPHEEEARRILDSPTAFAETARGGRLVVEKPKPQVRYLIYWALT